MNMQGVQQSPMQRQQQQQQQQQQQHQHQQQQQQQQQQRAVAMGSPYASPGNMSAATSPYGQHSPPVTYSSGQQPVPPPTQQTPSKSLSTSVGRSETPGGADHDQLVTELMNQVESKRSELESMTMSVVQWKQNFKDKLKQEKKDIERDKEMREASIMNRLSVLQDKASGRMMKLQEKIWVAVAFQKLRENRKQVLWLQRVKELKVQCEGLREEASIAASNSASGSVEFSQGEFASRVLASLSNLIAFTQGSEVDLEGSWLMTDILGVGNAVVGEKLKQLLMAVQRLKASESNLHRRTSDLARGNGAVAGLQARVSDLERELASKRRAVEALSLQLDMDNTPSRSAGGGVGGGAGGSGNFQIEMLQRDLQALTEVKISLEEENTLLRRQGIEAEEGNNVLRGQLASARMETGAKDGQSKQQPSAYDETLVKSLTELREEAEANARGLGEALARSREENTNLRELLEDARRGNARANGGQQQDSVGDANSAGGGGGSSELLQLIQLRAGADKRAEEAEAVLKQEQHNVWKLKSEIKLLEARLGGGAGDGRGSSSGALQRSSDSPKLQPRDSMNSILSGQSTSPTSSEVMNLRRELKVMGELRDAALQSLEALRGDVGDSVPNIDYAHLRVDAKIGSGSFAEVFRGEWTRPCAVKKLRGLTRRRQLQDFYREAQILSMVHHPGVVQLMGICMNIPELYLVTELVVGGSLEDVMHIEKRRLGHSEVLSIAVQIADAVQSLHIANVVHRDLKPSNCLIDHQGVVKLCDFGLARVTEKDPSQNSESSRAGTPVYLAPEALQGAPTTNKVDVYSYGIICWEMLTGLQAWVSLDYKQMVNAVLRDRKRPHYPPETNKEWKLLVDSCWVHDPVERPSFSSIVVSLQEMGAQKPIRQSTPNTPFKNVELV